MTLRQCRRFFDDKARRYRFEKWFWLANVPGVMGLVVFVRSFWEVISIPYVAFLSIYALVITAGGAEQAAEAAANSRDQGSP